ELVGQQRERPADAVGRAGGGQSRDHGRREQGGGERDGRHARAPHQNVTEGWCAPNTARSRSQISPSVAACSTASTISGRRLARPRAPVSSASRARAARPASRVLRTRATRSASAALTPGSTEKRTALAERVARVRRSEEHTSELQSPDHIVCRLLLEKK